MDQTKSVPQTVITAKSMGLLHCHGCGRLLPKAFEGASCPRCGATVHTRKPESLSRAWAFLLAAMVAYIPANIYPIMTVIMFGSGSPDTIISGVIHLIHADQWSIALLVFFASIFVPILKILVLMVLLISVQRGWRWRARQRSLMYRITEGIGRWSMIDIFMISILVGLVKLGRIATIEAGPGATAFALVVILTMFAAMSFDPRLIWDVMEDDDDAA
jgi:paraquat-inducible protein A